MHKKLYTIKFLYDSINNSWIHTKLNKNKVLKYYMDFNTTQSYTYRIQIVKADE